MSANLAAKYEKQFDEAFKPTSYFEGKVNPRFKFDGAKTIRGAAHPDMALRLKWTR